MNIFFVDLQKEEKHNHMEHENKQERAENEQERSADNYILYIAKKCRIRRALHIQSRAWYHRRFQYVTICSIVLSLITAVVSQLPFQGEWWFKYVLGVFALVASTNAAIVKFLGFESLQNEHSLAAQKFLALRESVRLQMFRKPEHREAEEIFMTHVSQNYNNILANSPLISVCVVESEPICKDELLCDACDE